MPSFVWNKNICKTRIVTFANGSASPTVICNAPEPFRACVHAITQPELDSPVVCHIMPRYGEFGGNAFIAGTADVESYISSATPDGHFFLLAWISYDRGGAAVFLFKMCLSSGVLDITRRGPALPVHPSEGPQILIKMQKRMGGIGVRFRPIDAFSALTVVVDTLHASGSSDDGPSSIALQSWFPAARAFLTSMHAALAHSSEKHYTQEYVGGTFQAAMASASEAATSLTPRDMHVLAVQCPYLHMTGTRGTPSHTALGGDEELQRKAALKRCYEEKLDASYRHFLSKSQDHFEKAPPVFLAAHMSDVILPQGLVDERPMPQAIHRLVSPAKSLSPLLASLHPPPALPREPTPSTTERSPKHYKPSSPIPPSLTPKPPSFDRRAPPRRPSPPKVPVLGLQRTHLALPGSAQSARQSSLSAHPWLLPHAPDSSRPSTSLPPHLGRAFPQSGRVLMAALELQAHNDLTGYGWPEFEATKRGRCRVADDDAAGICARGMSHRVASAVPGVVCQSYKRLLQGEKLVPPDNDQGEAFHRLSLATSQQRYLRCRTTRDDFHPTSLPPATPVVCTGRSTCLTART